MFDGHIDGMLYWVDNPRADNDLSTGNARDGSSFSTKFDYQRSRCQVWLRLNLPEIRDHGLCLRRSGTQSGFAEQAGNSHGNTMQPMAKTKYDIRFGAFE